MTPAPPPVEQAETQAKSEPQRVSRMSFGAHLEDLRSCIINALVGILVATIGCLVFGKDILSIIVRPLLEAQHAAGLPPQLQVLAPTAAFTAFLKVGILSGLIVAMPWVLYQMWRFVASGLYEHERRFLRLLTPASLGLFILGVVFLYFVVLPLVFRFFISFNQSFDIPTLMPTARQVEKATGPIVELPLFPVLAEDPTDPAVGSVWINETNRRLNVQTEHERLTVALTTEAANSAMQSGFAIDYYVSFVLVLALAFGIAFETPVVVFFLAWTRIVSTATMARGRRYVLMITVLFAAVLTPPDVVSQVALAVPMYLLFEIGLRFARLAEPRKPAT